MYNSDFRINLQLFAGEKTEPATPRRREEVRKKGQVAKSGEIGTTALIIAGFWALKSFGSSIFSRLGLFTTTILNDVTRWDGSADSLMNLFIFVVIQGLLVLLPIFLILFLVAIISQAVQVGFMLNWSIIMPKFSRINPIEGFKRIFSKRAFLEFAKSVFKIVIIGSMVYQEVKKSLEWIPNLPHLSTVDAVVIITQTVTALALRIGVTLFILAAFDYLYQRWEFEKSIRMSKQEIKEEYKMVEGDPQIKAKIRQKQREIATRRMMEAVPTADVIVTNPTHYAVALLYKADEMASPEVVAKGAGGTALRIREIANEHNVPTVENPPLARTLFKTVDIGQQIPPELYPAVAEVLAFVYRLRRRR
ncbi:MAG: flagellar biosynthesis protein FlhB [Firmicutes bacterium]|nr:flagellar biosynthesis protein FlhB [Bacillota bacterium]